MRNPKRQECERFAELYLFEAGCNATKAAKMLCGETGKELSNSSLPHYASALLNSEDTKYRLGQIRKEMREESQLRREEIIWNLKEIAFDREAYSNSTRLRALDLLCRIGGFYNDSLEMKGNQTINVTLTD